MIGAGPAKLSRALSNLEVLRHETPLLIALILIGAALGGLLVGYEPQGGDPDRLYRPLKAELARALAAGTLPFWSERFGLGVPLVAESQVGAFYPVNLLLYRVLDVAAAYRLSMWLHYVALVAATYALTRCLGMTSWGSALGAVAFTLCGFQAIHSSNEPFYSIMPYLPLALVCSERYMARGSLAWLALLAMCLGIQWTLGHYQIQSWTAGLVIWTGVWRALLDRRPWWRVLGLAAGILWGAALAAVQLGLSWQFARLVGQMQRTPGELLWYSFPPMHWFELALPRLIRELRMGPEDPYWHREQSWGYEAALYVGTIPLVFAFVSLFGRPRSSSTLPWRLLIPLGFAMATVPRWWPQASLYLAGLPGQGYFRVPARYTLLPSLGLAVLAAEGLDRAISGPGFRRGLTGACAFGVAAAAAAWRWTMRSDVQLAPPMAGLPAGFLWSGLAWGIALAVVLLWRSGRLGAWAPIAAASVELGILFYLGTTHWGRPIVLPAASPILAELVRLSPHGLVGGEIENLPVRAGLKTGYPYTGFALAQPNRLLMLLQQRLVKGASSGPGDGIAPGARSQLLRRFRVSHLAASQESLVELGRLCVRLGDPALDHVVYHSATEPAVRSWAIVELGEPIAVARVARRARTMPDVYALVDRFAHADDLDIAWFLREDRVPERPDARSARLLSWDGRVARIDHEGPCDLVIARSFDPGWLARTSDGPEAPVVPVDGGFQAVRITGSGTDSVTLRYQPARLLLWTSVSLVSAVLAFGVLLAAPVFQAARNVLRGSSPQLKARACPARS
jgi:hypothetical protein